MKLYICNKCEKVFFPTEVPLVLDEDKIPNSCPKCGGKLVEFYPDFTHREKEREGEGDNFNYLDEFCNQLKRIKSISPEFRIGQIIYLINHKLLDDWDFFYIEDKDYVEIAENYADKLEREREKEREERKAR